MGGGSGRSANERSIGGVSCIGVFTGGVREDVDAWGGEGSFDDGANRSGGCWGDRRSWSVAVSSTFPDAVLVVRFFTVLLPSLEIDLMLVPRRRRSAIPFPLFWFRLDLRRLLLISPLVQCNELFFSSTDLLLQLSVLQKERLARNGEARKGEGNTH
jgi:hypothetical protein